MTNLASIDSAELNQLRKESCRVGMAKSLIEHTSKSVGAFLKQWPDLDDNQRFQRLVGIREDLALAPDLEA